MQLCQLDILQLCLLWFIYSTCVFLIDIVVTVYIAVGCVFTSLWIYSGQKKVVMLIHAWREMCGQLTLVWSSLLAI